MSASSFNRRSSSSRFACSDGNLLNASAKSPIGHPDSNNLHNITVLIVIRKLFTFYVVVKTFSVFPACAQPTNAPLPKTITATNAATSTNNLVRANKLPLGTRKALAIKRLNEQFDVTRDQVEEQTKISLKKLLHGRNENDDIDLDIVCYITAKEPIPSSIMLHFISRSEDWKFLSYSRLVINCDGEKRDFGDLEVHTHVRDNATVLEQMFVNIDYDFFRKMAYSKTAMLNLGSTKNSSFQQTTKEIWKRLFEYFDVIQEEDDLKKARVTEPQASFKSPMKTTDPFYTPFYTPESGFRPTMAYRGLPACSWKPVDSLENT